MIYPSTIQVIVLERKKTIALEKMMIRKRHFSLDTYPKKDYPTVMKGTNYVKVKSE